MFFWYCFWHQVDLETNWCLKSEHARKLIWDTDTTIAPSWANVRYKLETHLRISERDYLESVPPLDDHCTLKNEQKIVLRRKPLDKSKGHVPYVPLMLVGTEEEKIMMLMKFANASAAAGQQHASEIQEKVVYLPAPAYECAYCRAKGEHYIADCPRKLQGLQPRRQPKGIPKTMLREAQTDEEKVDAFLTDDGKLLVLKVR